MWGEVAEFQAEKTAWAEAGARQMQLEAAGARNVMWRVMKMKWRLKRQIGIDPNAKNFACCAKRLGVFPEGI